MKPGLVVVLAGGPSNERQVSLWTAETISETLNRLALPYQQIDPRSPGWLNHLKRLRPTVVLLALHGTFGEDGTVQKYLEDADIPFTGSGSETAQQTFNKITAKQTVEKLGYLTPAWQLATQTQVSPSFPVVVKPAREGSSYGVTIAWQQHELEPAITVAQKYDNQVVIEEYVAGTEVTCGVIDVFGQTQALPLVEIRPDAEFFDFQAKYDARYCHEICPATVDSHTTRLIQDQSIKIYEAFGCCQYARIDWLIRDHKPYFLELNTLPGMTKTSLITKELTAARIDFDHFIATLIATAPKIRHNGKRKS